MFFIVNDKTFKHHLEYMFAGTGAGNRDAIFIENSQETSIHSTTERNLVGMIADVSRIRKNDKVIFYLTGCAKFYGFFKIEDIAFYDNANNNYLNSNLGKLLTFRVLIKPDKVYAEGITENECLDSLNGILHPFEMCWSLIYRKLKGNRDCTMILDYESARIEELIKVKNNNRVLDSKYYSYDSINDKIVTTKNNNIYSGKKGDINIKDRMLFKAARNNAFEVHLQAYIMQNFDKQPLNELLFPKLDGNMWIGNEVSCGVGMQRIDVMTIVENNSDVYIKIIELKQSFPYNDIVEIQLKRYLKWCDDYVIPNFKNKNIVIEPVVIARKTNAFNDFKNTCLNIDYGIINGKLLPISYIGFDIKNNDIYFEKIF